MTTWAIIPVKPLFDSKRRLAHLLSAAERADLIHSFLDELLAALNETHGIDRVLVVSGDRSVLALAEKYGAALLVEAEPLGLNAAVSHGIAHAGAQGATAALILPADLPFARTTDIEAMLRPLGTAQRPFVALTGDEDEEGTNALLLAPPGDFTFHYGPGSFAAHLAEAVERGRSTYVVNAPGLRFDLDTEADWRVFCGETVGGD
jgi:2-phospho-L-lactate guanylyltransferase